jgi:hypothetical protein
MTVLNKADVLAVISDMIFKSHLKMDNANLVTPETKSKNEGYIEALYQVESLINNFESENKEKL